MDEMKETTVLVKSVCGACGEVSLVEEKGMDALDGPQPGQWMEPDGAGFTKKRRAAKKKRIRKIAGLNSARAAEHPADVPLEASKDASEDVEVKDIDIDAFYKCLATGDLHDDGAEKCTGCGGDCSSKELPQILEIEGYAEELFGAKVHESGYSAVNDEFIVVLEKDGLFSEAFFKGANGQLLGWQLADMSDSKSEPISMEQAAELAVKSVEGVAGNVEAGQIEGLDVWTVQVDGPNGEDFDVFVSLDGEVLGFDEYEVAMKSDPLEDEEEKPEEDLEEDQEEKRMFSTEEREELADEGEALPDGSYPIEDEEDLKNAIQAYGRAKDKAAAKAHIVKRAKELGLESLLPDSWDGEKSGSVDVEFMKALAEFQSLELG